MVRLSEVAWLISLKLGHLIETESGGSTLPLSYID